MKKFSHFADFLRGMSSCARALMCCRRILPQSSLSAFQALRESSSLPEGAFWQSPLQQYEVSSTEKDKDAVQTEAPSGRELAAACG